MLNKQKLKKAQSRKNTEYKFQKRSNKFPDQTSTSITRTTDIDSNGIVDGSEQTGYQLYNSGAPLFITNKSGKTFSNNTSTKWSIIAAATEDKSHFALAANHRSKRSKYKIWTLNDDGVIRSKGRWLLGSILSAQGYEKVFSIDFNNDGIIEGDSPVDAGDARFVLLGDAATGQKLKVIRDEDDPDGNGRPLITWQTSSLEGWKVIDYGRALKLPAILKGSQIRAKIEYIDGDGFSETVFTEQLTIPYVDDGDASFLIQGTAAVGQTLSIERSTDDPDGNGDGTPTISWLQSSDGVNWSLAGTTPTFSIPNTLEGRRITASVSYTDAQGFNESINTDDLTIPYVDDGDASFLIQGTAAVGQTISIERSTDDPDGNGDNALEITWQASLDGISWWELGSLNTLQIRSDLGGYQLNAVILYTDGQGFKETIITDTVYIENTPRSNDDYGDDINTNGQLPINSNISGELESAGDHDWFAINLVAGQRYQFDLDGVSLEDPHLKLRNSSSLLVAENDDKSQISLDSKIIFTADSSGTHYLDVGSFYDQNIGTYILRASEHNDDYSDNISTNGQLSINSNISGELESAGDHDWFAINLVAGQRYQFDLNGMSLEDPHLKLRDSSSLLVAENDDKSQTSLDSQLVFTAESSGTYYLDAGSFYDAYTGSYTLRAAELSAPDHVFSRTDGYGNVSAQRAFEQLLDISLEPVDALGGNLWGLDNIDVPEVWNVSRSFTGATGSGVTIAVIDTGVDLDHPELSGRIVAGYDFVDGDSKADDGNGHGTHVAATIAGANDGTGITGVAYDAEIMPLRVLDNDGYGWTSDIIAAVRFAADSGADVINMSLGGGGYSQAMADAIGYASRRGSVVVMAAGNSGGRAPEYPAAHAIDHGIAVGAVDNNRSLAGFSNRAGSTQLDYVTAPGVNIYSAVPGGGYETLNGTSMAAPHVAGVAGLLKGHDNSLSASAIEDLLTGSGSNNTSSSSVWSTPPSSSLSTQDVITLQTLGNFSDNQLSGTLIASIGGNGQDRRSTVRELKQDIRSNVTSYSGLDAVKKVEASRHKFAMLEISDDRSVNQRALLTELLESNQFHYFEIDQQFTIV